MHAPRLSMLMILAALSVAGCGVDQAQPAPVIDEDQWGQLPPDPDRPQQAEAPATGPQG